MTDLSLKKHPTITGVQGPVLICVMDGVGKGAGDESDAVHLARTPTLDWLAAHSPSCLLNAHGKAVGMPSDGDMGNSEVGHNALGAGRVFDQGAKLVAGAIDSGQLFEGDSWKTLMVESRERGATVHFLGLLSDGNVHSHIDHLSAMLTRCDQEGIEAVRVHVLLDGRDVSETSALRYVRPLESLLSALSSQEKRDYRIASGGGRMQLTMDRYGADWDMVERGYNLHVRGDGRGFTSAETAVRTLREESPGVIDQDLPGFVVVDDGGTPVGRMRDGDAVILFNFRGDRALEISQALADQDFSAFERREHPTLRYAGMMEYDGDLKIPTRFLVAPPVIDRPMSEYLAHSRVTQFACSETQKFGHVTYFWNGNRSGQFDESRETYVEVRSDRVPFEQRPWMKAAEITDATLRCIKDGSFRHGRINYANGDMVGHTGKLEAAVHAVQTVDLQLARLLPVIEKLSGALIVTADHGNADEMFERNKAGVISTDEHGKRMAKTSHTLNQVPCHIYAPSAQLKFNPQLKSPVENPGLANVAATSLQLMGYAPPDGFAPGLLG